MENSYFLNPRKKHPKRKVFGHWGFPEENPDWQCERDNTDVEDEGPSYPEENPDNHTKFVSQPSDKLILGYTRDESFLEYDKSMKELLKTSKFFDYITEKPFWFNNHLHIFLSTIRNMKEYNGEKIEAMIKKEYSDDFFIKKDTILYDGDSLYGIKISWHPDTSWACMAPEMNLLIAFFEPRKIIFDSDNFYEAINNLIYGVLPNERFTTERIAESSKKAKSFLEDICKNL